MTHTVSRYDAKMRCKPVPLELPAGLRRRPGLFVGRIRIDDDFDAPWPDDMHRALEGEDPIEPDIDSEPKVSA